MGTGLVNVDVGSIVKGAADLIGEFHTSDKEKADIAYRELQLESNDRKEQIEVNKIEAAHKSLFVAGWRPAIGWIGAISLGYKFIVYELLCWLWSILQALTWLPTTISPPPTLDASELYPIILGLLGLGTMRTYEGIKNVKTTSLSVPKTEEKKKWFWQK